MKLFGYNITKAETEGDAYMMNVYRYLQRGVPVPIADNPSAYINMGFAYNPIVYSVVSMRANAAKSIPLLVYKIKNGQKMKLYKSMDTRYGPLDLHKAQELKEQSLEEVEGTPLNSLFENPNGSDTIQDIIEKIFIYRDVTGNAYLYTRKNEVTGKVTGLHILPADKVKIIGGSYFEPVKGYTVGDIIHELIEPENVLHWKYPNTQWQPDGRWLYGMSPLKPARDIIAQDNMAIASQSSAFLNEGLKGILTGTDQTDIEFTKEQGEQLERNFKSKSGYKNAKNIAFARAPLNFLKIGETPIDLETLEARRMNKEILCNIYRIHPSLLSSDASTLNNLTEARKALLTMSVLPDMETLKWHINNRVAQSYGMEYYVDFDLMAISELQDDIEKLGRTLAGMDWITTNEKRTATQYDRYDDEAADRLYQSFGVRPMGEDIDTGFDHIDRNL